MTHLCNKNCVSVELYRQTYRQRDKDSERLGERETRGDFTDGHEQKKIKIPKQTKQTTSYDKNHINVHFKQTEC